MSKQKEKQIMEYKNCGCRDDDHDSCPICEGWSQKELDRMEEKKKSKNTVPKFTTDQKVNIKSTDELPTSHDGDCGWIVRQIKSHPEFWVVNPLKLGEFTVFHESQLEEIPVAIV